MDPQKKEAENTLVRLVTARQHADGSFEAAPGAAQVAEVWFLNLGDPDDRRLECALLRMPDTAFSATLTAGQKREVLQKEFGLRMTAEMAKNLEEMQNMELAIEARAREKWMSAGLAEGIAEGWAEGKTEGLIQMGLALKVPRQVIMDQLVPVFSSNEQEAERALNGYIQKHPEEAAYLED